VMTTLASPSVCMHAAPAAPTAVEVFPYTLEILSMHVVHAWWGTRWSPRTARLVHPRVVESVPGAVLIPPTGRSRSTEPRVWTLLLIPSPLPLIIELPILALRIVLVAG
jgi:hypothetical protein